MFDSASLPTSQGHPRTSCGRSSARHGCEGLQQWGEVFNETFVFACVVSFCVLGGADVTVGVCIYIYINI